MTIASTTTHLRQGDLAWNIIKRADKYGIRLRDLKHPRIDALDHIPAYPVNTAYVVEATLDPFDEPKTMTVATPVEGFTESYQCPGELALYSEQHRACALPLYVWQRIFPCDCR